MDAWRDEGKVLAATAILFPSCGKHQPGVLVGMARFQSLCTLGLCFDQREQSGLARYNGTRYEGYKRCCICGIHVNNSSYGKPCLKARTTFHSKNSILFSATLTVASYQPSLWTI